MTNLTNVYVVSNDMPLPTSIINNDSFIIIMNENELIIMNEKHSK